MLERNPISRITESIKSFHVRKTKLHREVGRPTTLLKHLLPLCVS